MHKFFQINGGTAKSNRHQFIILAAWALLNIFFLIKNGIVTTGEAEKYIGQAKLLLQTGTLSAPNLWFYFIEIFLIGACIKLHLSFAVAVIIHLFFNLAATFCFYRTLSSVFSSNSIALTGTLLLLFNLPYQEFNSFLQTESLFYSFTLMLSCYILNKENPTSKNLVVVCFLLVVISMTRPTGLLYILPAFLYVFFTSSQKLSLLKKTGLLSFFLLIFFFIINKALSSGGEFDFMLPFKDEDIICGNSTVIHPTNVNTIESGNSIFGLFYYIMHNFSQFIRLAWLKTIAFFGLYRTYYSKWHNVYLIAYYYPILIMAIVSSAYWIKNHSYKFMYLVSVVLITWLTVTLTCDDWHNRFYFSIVPYIIFLSVGTVRRLKK